MGEIFCRIRDKLRRLSVSNNLPTANDLYKVVLAQGREDFEKKYSAQIERPFGLDAFDVNKTLGTGSFGSVYLVQHKQSGTYLAMKVLNKEKVVELKQVEHTLSEKRILQAISFPFIVSMPYSFKDNANLYMILEYINGGELFTHLRRNRRFSEVQSRFYAAQLVLTVEYLHSLDIMYGDLKPENVLLDSRGYIKLTDFGFAKRIKGKTFTLCGTPEYLAPEIILCKGYTKAVDWWALGILIYEMTVGHPPFYSDQPIKTYEKIVAGKANYMPHQTQELRDLLQNLLRVDPITRYGSLRNGASDIKSHTWFNGLEWFDIYHKKVEAPFKPTVNGFSDSTNFAKYAEQPLPKAAVELCPQFFADF
jgi:protein kinase A